MSITVKARHFEIELGFLSGYLRVGSRDWYWNSVR
jgi:hypothetical protein